MNEKKVSKISHAEIFGGICALFVLIGAFLPWASVISIFGSMSISGIDRDGMITFILSILAFGAIYFGVMKQKKGASSISIILLGLLIALTAVVDGIGVGDISSESEYLYMQIGIGLYLTGIGGVGLIFAGLWIFSKKDKKIKPHADRHCPNCGRDIPFESKLCPYCGKKFINYLESDVDKTEEFEQMKDVLE